MGDNMAFAEDEAKAFLMDLVKKPEFPAGEIATVYREVISFHNEMFPAYESAADARKKKRRRSSQVVGWPAGVAKSYTTEVAADPETEAPTIVIDPTPTPAA